MSTPLIVNKRKYTKQQMRIKVAKDVIKTLTTTPRRLVVRSSNGYLRQKSLLSSKDLDKELNSKLKNCEVCALGAMLIADLDLRDRCKVRDLIDFNERFEMQDSVSDFRLSTTIDLDFCEFRLKDYFSSRQLDMIEIAFEQSNPFTADIKDDKERLIAIMNNIIRNKGTFKTDNWRR